MRRWVLIGVLLAVAEAGWAQQTMPATQDVSTPKGVLQHLAIALQEGDSPAIQECLYAANPAETKMVTAVAEMASALAALHRQAVKAFGEVAAGALTGDAESSPATELRRIDSARVLIEGDRATLSFAGPDEAPVVLRRMDGRWRLPMAEMSKGLEAGALEQRLTDLAAQTRLITEVSGEISAGKYKTADQAAEAWRTKMMQALSTRPSETQPATTRAGGEGG